MVAGSPADADDLAQDALLRAVRAIRSYDAVKGSPEAWLWRIVANTARDAARARDWCRARPYRLAYAALRACDSVRAAVRTGAGRRRERARWVLGRLTFAAPRESESVEAAVLTRLRDADLHAQMRLLPHRDRTLLALRYGAGLETDEVGAAVGLSPDSAGRAIRRALARLRARLEVTRR
jgi:RNA polymerase sigma-70 factor (ECF subfamily)